MQNQQNIFGESGDNNIQFGSPLHNANKNRGSGMNDFSPPIIDNNNNADNRENKKPFVDNNNNIDYENFDQNNLNNNNQGQYKANDSLACGRREPDLESLKRTTTQNRKSLESRNKDSIGSVIGRYSRRQYNYNQNIGGHGHNRSSDNMREFNQQNSDNDVAGNQFRNTISNSQLTNNSAGKDNQHKNGDRSSRANIEGLKNERNNLNNK